MGWFNFNKKVKEEPKKDLSPKKREPKEIELRLTRKDETNRQCNSKIYIMI